MIVFVLMDLDPKSATLRKMIGATAVAPGDPPRGGTGYLPGLRTYGVVRHTYVWRVMDGVLARHTYVWRVMEWVTATFATVASGTCSDKRGVIGG